MVFLCYNETVSGNSYTNTYVAKGVPYYYKLEASYEDNEGYKTATTYAGKCIINPLPAPSSLEASTGNSHSITVKCKASDDCDGYQIYRSVSPDGNYELVQTVSNESRSSWWYDDDESFQTYTQKNLELGKIYYYKIRPYTTYIDETFYGDFSNCIPSIKEMFKEIYKSKERFPIHEIGCYSWRGKNSSSEHCEGLAFDINSNENYMIQGKKALAGSFWKPKKNRYSIPLNCKLVKILEKYGFNRGLWGSRRDYMHFLILVVNQNHRLSRWFVLAL